MKPTRSFSPAVLLLAAATLAPALIVGCAKKREEPQKTAAPVVKPASSVQCNFESAVASAKLEVDVLSLDLPASEVRRVLTCAHGALSDCAGTLGDDKPRLEATEIGAVVQVDKRGFVTDVKLRPTKGAPPSAELNACVEGIVRRMSFPTPEKDAAELRLGFTYEPRPFEELEKLPRFAGAKATLESFEAATGAVPGLPRAGETIERRARGCYLLALQGADATKGAIAFELLVSPKGVDDVKTTPDGTMGKDFVSCVDTVLRNTKLEPPKTNAKVRGKLVFQRAP